MTQQFGSFINYINTTSDIPHYGLVGLGVPDFPHTANILSGTIGRLEQKLTNATFAPLVIIGSGCDTQDGDRNCTQVCGDASSLFRSWATEWTCLTLASLAFAEAHQQLDRSANRLIQDAVSHVGINDISDFDWIGVLEKTHSCAEASCRRDEADCLREDSSFNLNASTPVVVSFNELSERLSQVCDGVQGELDTDIAGPGVLISYMIQIFITLYSHISVRVATARKSINEWKELWRRITNGEASSRNHSHLSRKLGRFEASSFAHATSTLLVDFQEAQSFFVMAIGVTMLYANSPNTGFDDSGDWGTLLNNRFGIRSIAIHEGWCMLLMLLNLRRVGLDSIYCLVLSTLAVITVGVAAYQTTLDPDPKQVYEMLKDKNTLPECGNNPSLRTFCVNSSTPSSILNMVPDCAAFIPILIVLVCWLENLCSRTVSASWFQRHSYRLSQTQRASLARIQIFVSRLLSIVLAVAEMVMVIFLWYGLCILGISSGPRYNNLVGVKWNIGQVIAVLVWAPVISKYLYPLLCVEMGFKVRLPKSFKITRVSDRDEGEGYIS